METRLLTGFYFMLAFKLLPICLQVLQHIALFLDIEMQILTINSAPLKYHKQHAEALPHVCLPLLKPTSLWISASKAKLSEMYHHFSHTIFGCTLDIGSAFF